MDFSEKFGYQDICLLLPWFYCNSVNWYVNFKHRYNMQLHYLVYMMKEKLLKTLIFHRDKLICFPFFLSKNPNFGGDDVN
jgi:hypothetical protein